MTTAQHTSRSSTSLRAEWRANSRRRRRLQAHGKPSTDLVDATPAREHLEALEAAGMGWMRAARQAGLPPRTVANVVRGYGGRPPTRRVRPDTAARILAVQLDPTRRTSLPGVGARRRLQALVALGWTCGQLAEQIGWDRRNLATLLRTDEGLHAASDVKIRALYDRLWDVNPPEDTPWERYAAGKARAWAKRRGWVVPLGWNDEDLDDPDATPAVTTVCREIDRQAVEQLVAGHITGDRTGPAERLAAVTQLTADGWSARAIAAQVGMHQRSVIRLRGRAS